MADRNGSIWPVKILSLICKGSFTEQLQEENLVKSRLVRYQLTQVIPDKVQRATKHMCVNGRNANYQLDQLPDTRKVTRLNIMERLVNLH